MIRIMLKSKIAMARITGTQLEYEGSITVDADLLEAANILHGEQVQVLNINNGNRFITYGIAAQRGSGMVILNGPAARLGMKGDTIIILSYCEVDDREAGTFESKIVLTDGKNHVTEIKQS
jgi:aspartate 1-decarboxylase